MAVPPAYHESLPCTVTLFPLVALHADLLLPRRRHRPRALTGSPRSRPRADRSRSTIRSAEAAARRAPVAQVQRDLRHGARAREVADAADVPHPVALRGPAHALDVDAQGRGRRAAVQLPGQRRLPRLAAAEPRAAGQVRQEQLADRQPPARGGAEEVGERAGRGEEGG